MRILLVCSLLLSSACHTLTIKNSALSADLATGPYKIEKRESSKKVYGFRKTDTTTFTSQCAEERWAKVEYLESTEDVLKIGVHNVLGGLLVGTVSFMTLFACGAVGDPSCAISVAGVVFGFGNVAFAPLLHTSVFASHTTLKWHCAKV